MKDYIALVTVELHKFPRRIAGSSGQAAAAIAEANERNRLVTLVEIDRALTVLSCG